MATFPANWQGNFYVETNVVLVSQSAANNTSTIDIGVWFGAAPGYWVGANFSAAAEINGAAYGHNTQNREIGSGGREMFAYTRRTVTHKSDGTLSLNINGWVVANNVIPFAMNSGGVYTLPTLARATTPNWSGNFEAGTAKTISLPRASSSYTHDLYYYFGTLKDQPIVGGAGVSASWTPPLSMLEQIPSSGSGVGTLRVFTKSGGTVIGWKDKSFTLTAPPSVKPDVSAVTWDDINTTLKTNIGGFVQGLSQVKGTVTAAGVYGSVITKKQLRIGDTVVPESTQFAVDGAGVVAASGEATDSRGRVGSKVANFTVLAYEPPHLGVNGFQVRRANSSNVATDQGTYLRLDLHAIATSLKPGTTEKNALKIAVFTRPQAGGAWTARNVVNPGLTHNGAIQLAGGSAYPITSAYDVKIELTDNTGVAPTILQTVVPTATVTLDLNGTKVGVGKYWEQGVFDVGGEIYSNGERVATWETPMRVFTSKSQLDSWTAPDNARAWVTSEKAEYARRNGLWVGGYQLLTAATGWNVSDCRVRPSGDGWVTFLGQFAPTSNLTLPTSPWTVIGNVPESMRPEVDARLAASVSTPGQVDVVVLTTGVVQARALGSSISLTSSTAISPSGAVYKTAG